MYISDSMLRKCQMQAVKKQQHSSGNGTQNVEMPTVNEMSIASNELSYRRFKLHGRRFLKIFIVNQTLSVHHENKIKRAVESNAASNQLAQLTQSLILSSKNSKILST